MAPPERASITSVFLQPRESTLRSTGMSAANPSATSSDVTGPCCSLSALSSGSSCVIYCQLCDLYFSSLDRYNVHRVAVHSLAIIQETEIDQAISRLAFSYTQDGRNAHALLVQRACHTGHPRHQELVNRMAAALANLESVIHSCSFRQALIPSALEVVLLGRREQSCPVSR